MGPPGTRTLNLRIESPRPLLMQERPAGPAGARGSSGLGRGRERWRGSPGAQGRGAGSVRLVYYDDELARQGRGERRAARRGRRRGSDRAVRERPPKRHGQPRMAEPGPRHQRRLLRRRGCPCRGLLESALRPKAVGLVAAAMQEFPQALGTHAEGFLGRASGSRVSPTSPSSDPVQTRSPGASGPRALRPTVRPPRPTPSV